MIKSYILRIIAVSQKTNEVLDMPICCSDEEKCNWPAQKLFSE